MRTTAEEVLPGDFAVEVTASPETLGVGLRTPVSDFPTCPLHTRGGPLFGSAGTYSGVGTPGSARGTPSSTLLIPLAQDCSAQGPDGKKA